MEASCSHPSPLTTVHDWLQDPLHLDSLCGRTLEYLLDILVTNNPCLYCSATTETGFLPALLGFLLTPIDITALNKHLGRCKCDFMQSYVRSIHLRAPRGQFSLATILQQLLYLCYKLIKGLKPGRAYRITSCTSEKKVSIDWLHNIANLLPEGPEIAVRCLEEWSKFLGTSTPTKIFCALHRHCPSLLIHAKNFFSQNITIAETIVYKLQDRLWGESLPHHIAPEHQIRELFDLFDILDEDYAKDSDGHIIFSNDSHRIFKISRDIFFSLNRISYSCSKLEHDQVRIAYFMKKLWTDQANRDWSEEETIPEEALRVLDYDGSEYDCCGGNSSLPIFRRHINCLMEGALEGPHCGYFDCRNTVESIGEPFRRCSSCGVARYCSKECQKASWKATGRQSHRRVCCTLKKLKSVRQKSGKVYEIPAEILEEFPDEELKAVTAYLKRKHDWDYDYDTDSSNF